MRKILLLTLLISLAITSANAQRKLKQLDEDQTSDNNKTENPTNDSWKEKIFFGGNLGVGFSSGNTFVLIQPMVGYKVTEKFSAGLSPLYMYRSFELVDYLGKKYSFSDNIFGPGVFAKFSIIENLFAYSEYLGVSYKQFDSHFNLKRVWSNNMFVGGGYLSGTGGKGAYIMVLYNVLYDPNNSFYSSPLDIRVGFQF